MPIQLEFDFGEPTKKDGQAEKPKPALPHFAAPRNDNERLLNWQYEYREKGDKNVLDSMYSLGRKIALKYINTAARKNRHVAELDADDKEEKAHNAIAYIIARYLKDKDFAMEKSFTAYIYLRVQHELFYQRKVDKIVRFVDEETLRGIRRINCV